VAAIKDTIWDLDLETIEIVYFNEIAPGQEWFVTSAYGEGTKQF
jgi:hypothetical protein